MGTVTDCGTSLPLARAIVDVTGGPSIRLLQRDSRRGTYSMKLAPGTYQVTFGGRSCATAGPFNVTITDGGTTVLNHCLQGAPVLTSFQLSFPAVMATVSLIEMSATR